MAFLTKLSLQKASVTLLLALALVAGGVYATIRINKELTPDIDLPLVTVVSAYPGVRSQDVAQELAIPLETAVSGVRGIKSLQSVSADGFAILIVYFDYGENMKEVEREVKENIAAAELPDGATTPNVTRMNINQMIPIVQLSLSGDIGTQELERIAREQIAPKLLAIDNVQAVDVIGGLTNQVSVVVNPVKMQAFGITRSTISGVLQANNVAIPSGTVSVEGNALSMRTVSTLTSIEEIENLAIGFVTSGTQPRPVLLKEVASVQITSAAATGISRTNGKDSVTMSVTKTQQGNTVSVANSVMKEVKELREDLRGQAEIQTILDQSDYIEESIFGLGREGLIGAIAAVIAIWVFLFSFRSAIVVGVSIPLSVLVAVLVLHFQGFTLNILTLGGLTIAVGRVVDDSIVVLENIFRKIQEGDDLNRSIIEGTKEVSTAVFGSTMTTIAVFLPLGFTGGIIGVFFRPFALTVTFALLASLVVALTVVPILVRLFVGRFQIGRYANNKEHKTAIQKRYLPVLSWALDHKVLTLVIAAVLFVGSFGLMRIIPTTFIDFGGENEFMVTMSLPPSSSPEEVTAKALEAEGIIKDLPGVVLYNTSIAYGASDSMLSLARALQGQSSQGASITVGLSEDTDLLEVQELARHKLGSIQGALVTVGGGGMEDMSAQLSVSLVGKDATAVRAAAMQILGEISRIDGLVDVSSAAAVQLPEVTVTVDAAKALAVGMTGAQIGMMLREIAVPQTVTKVSIDGGDHINLVMSTDPAYLNNIQALMMLPVGAAGVPLSSIADIQLVPAPAQVSRLDQEWSATITGTITAKNTGDVSSKVQKAIDKLDLPAGVSVKYGGVMQQFMESFNTLYVSIGAAIVIVYVVMVLVMGSLWNPFVIMFSLPLASIGALTALAATGRALSLSALFGVLMLVGIVVTNGIVLIDFVRQLRERGYSVHDALMEGGRLRLRPVLMTAVTTIIALLPMSLGFTEGAIIATELATVVIGGLITSTILTLVVVPVIYSIFEGFKIKLSGGAKSEKAETMDVDRGASGPA